MARVARSNNLRKTLTNFEVSYFPKRILLRIFNKIREMEAKAYSLRLSSIQTFFTWLHDGSRKGE